MIPLLCETTARAAETTAHLPEPAGPEVLLPAAALLLGTGVLAFAVLRRR